MFGPFTHAVRMEAVVAAKCACGPAVLEGHQADAALVRSRSVRRCAAATTCCYNYGVAIASWGSGYLLYWVA